ncbi:hypothetical protein CWI75_18005 [Kineobactrum sediminis]|uniref:DUF218 domain-containing protein n=1 Tax=Kineobactrum sediminis TaxID=1905677 RepID=A0A2N5XXV7_9GAMM|nr:YdcF family protein [Kineobactrum sediminis]PLW80988.1 hypothetical protein CWI75_18005 [Kineobactrum sediminis]
MDTLLFIISKLVAAVIKVEAWLLLGMALALLGLLTGRLLELRSRNTAENAALSLAVAQPQPGQTWVLVTSAFHMARAMHEFHQAGWPEMSPYPVDYRSGRFC